MAEAQLAVRRRAGRAHAAGADRCAAAIRTDYPLGAPVAQVLDTYVIAVAADGALVLVDQHAAHERLTHEALREQMLDGGVRSAAAAAAGGGRPAAGGCGPPAGRAAANWPGSGWRSRRSAPARCWCARCRPRSARPSRGRCCAISPTNWRSWTRRRRWHARLDAVIARLACHGSIRAGRRLNAAEMDALLRQMEATPRAATCSHGRPTFLKLSKAEIEKLFGRR